MLKSNPFVMGTFSYWKQVKINMISLEFEWAGSLRNAIYILLLLNRLLRYICSSLETKLEKENINVKVDIIHGVGDLQRRSQVIIVKTWILLINPTLDIPDLRDRYETDEECLENGREYCNGEIDCLKIA